MVAFFEDSRDAFRLFNKIMNGLRWFIRRAVIPVLLLVGGVFAITHDGHPPEWLKHWVDLFK